MNRSGGSRGSGHPWAGHGGRSPRDGPPFFRCGDGGLSRLLRAPRPNSVVWLRRGKPRLCGKLGDSSEPYKHRLWLQRDAPRFLHAVLDFIFQPDNIACFGVPAVDQRQRVLV